MTSVEPAVVEPVGTDGDVAAPAGPRWRRWSRATWSLARREWPFTVLLSLGALLRLVAMIGFHPIMWFNDSFEYLGVALRFHAYLIRPDGYSAFLRVLLPLHSFLLVAVLQHLMGLGVAVLVYALMRRWRIPRWVATIGSAPQLLDVHQIQLEQLLLSDTLFAFLVVAAVTMLGWHKRVGVYSGGAAGLALALAVLTRTVGIPLLILCGLYLLIRWSGWRSLVAFLAAALIPLGGYATYFHHQHGSYALNTSDGIFLYSRVIQFADCTKMHPSASIAILCDPRPPGQRPPSSNYIWHPSPLMLVDGIENPAVPELRFTSQRNDKALSFAIKAIESQPVDYLRTGWDDLRRSFTWSRHNFPNPAVLTGYSFTRSPHQPTTFVAVAGATAVADSSTYQGGDARTKLTQPFADFLIDYQRVGFLPGPFVAVLILMGFAGLVPFWRKDDRRRALLLMWAVGLAILVVPDLTAQFDYRYVMPSVPFLAAAAALSVAMLIPRLSGPEPARPEVDGARPEVDGARPEVDGAPPESDEAQPRPAASEDN